MLMNICILYTGTPCTYILCSYVDELYIYYILGLPVHKYYVLLLMNICIYYILGLPVQKYYVLMLMNVCIYYILGLPVHYNVHEYYVCTVHIKLCRLCQN